MAWDEEAAGNTFESYGRYLGYPTCCIKAFMFDLPPGVNAFTGTGFVPCCECVLLLPKLLVERINKARVHAVPFQLEAHPVNLPE